MIEWCTAWTQVSTLPYDTTVSQPLAFAVVGWALLCPRGAERAITKRQQARQT